MLPVPAWSPRLSQHHGAPMPLFAPLSCELRADLLHRNRVAVQPAAGGTRCKLGRPFPPSTMTTVGDFCACCASPLAILVAEQREASRRRILTLAKAGCAKESMRRNRSSASRCYSCAKAKQEQLKKVRSIPGCSSGMVSGCFFCSNLRFPPEAEISARRQLQKFRICKTHQCQTKS